VRVETGCWQILNRLCDKYDLHDVEDEKHVIFYDLVKRAKKVMDVIAGGLLLFSLHTPRGSHPCVSSLDLCFGLKFNGSKVARYGATVTIS